MKKLSWLMIIAIILSLGLAACGGSDTGVQEAAIENPVEEVEVVEHIH